MKKEENETIRLKEYKKREKRLETLKENKFAFSLSTLTNYALNKVRSHVASDLEGSIKGGRIIHDQDSCHHATEVVWVIGKPFFYQDPGISGTCLTYSLLDVAFAGVVAENRQAPVFKTEIESTQIPKGC